MAQYNDPIAETNNFIILNEYTRYSELHEPVAAYQSESELESEFVEDLCHLGYEDIRHLTSVSLLENVRTQLEALNAVRFTDAEWKRYLDEYLNCPNDTLIETTRKIHDNEIYAFKFDNDELKNIRLVDKNNVLNNKLQVLRQFKNESNRYDVTILVNGLPMVQIELKRRGVAIREAFNQVHRYSKESFNNENSLFKYLQIFVISNGTDTRYFANTLQRDKNSYDFTINWAKADNTLIKDLKDFSATFFQKNTLLQVLLKYSVFDVTNQLLIMRPYQIAATERILWKIQSAHEQKAWSKPEGGGYVWHTTGSGKTLTSFKTARLATQLDFIAKVFFVVDRKDLDYQTMKEYQRFAPDSVNGSESTEGLKRNIAKNDNKIIVTTLQKLNNLLKSEDDLPIYKEEVVFIFDEAHRSQFGEAQKNLKKRFKKYYQFGFTGTPIFKDNASGAETTVSVFGRELHAYVITDAIRDEKVLKFKVDYNDVRPKFRALETDKSTEDDVESNQALLHPERIKEIVKYILDNFCIKTHRNKMGNGFNAMFAVSSIEAAKCYYHEFAQQQASVEKPLRVATIFSFAANEEQYAKGEIADENFSPSELDVSAKEFLRQAIADYNQMFNCSFSIENFQEYYRDLAKRVKEQEVDLLIVVGMFLTGFDAPRLNTLFVDKNLRYHGLMQAYSRTNRIYDATKTFGNIVTFRDLEQATIKAIELFGDKNTRKVVLEKSYTEYLNGFTDITTGEARRGYNEIVEELQMRFPEPASIERESDKKEFVKLFGEYLRVVNILKNYDAFTQLIAFQKIDATDALALAEFKKAFFVEDADIEAMKGIEVLPEHTEQDYCSTYNDIRDWLRLQRAGQERPNTPEMDWDGVVFEIELLKSQEINLDYILELILKHHQKNGDKIALIEEIQRVLRSSMANRKKKTLVIDFINAHNIDAFKETPDIIKAFYEYAQEKQKQEAELLIREEGLKEEEARLFISRSLKRGFVNENGTELNLIFPGNTSPLNKDFLVKKKEVLQRLQDFVEKFSGIGVQV